MKKAWLVSGLHDCCVGKSFHKKIHHSGSFFIFVCILLKPTYLWFFFSNFLLCDDNGKPNLLF